MLAGDCFALFDLEHMLNNSTIQLHPMLNSTDYQDHYLVSQFAVYVYITLDLDDE